MNRPRPASDKSPPRARSGRRIIRILLVDDEEDFANYTAKRLSARGMQVQIAYNGHSALEVINGQPVDVVLLDLLMPGMDGFEVFREIRRVRPGAQVILLSGHADRKAVEQGEALGAADYIRKPCEFTTLLEAIRNADAQAPDRVNGNQTPQE